MSLPLALRFTTGPIDACGIEWTRGDLLQANGLLREHHYLGPVKAASFTFLGLDNGVPVAAQVWKSPTARRLPTNGRWLELARWCLTPAAGSNAGSRMHRYAVLSLREAFPTATTLVSYSDPSQGHTGALYRPCNWLWAPTWHRLRPPPSGLGSWDGRVRQEVKDRWVFPLRRDPDRAITLAVDDPAAVRAHLASAEWATTTSRWRCAVPSLFEEDG